MHAIRIVRRFFVERFGAIHGVRQREFLNAIDAVMAGSALTLTRWSIWWLDSRHPSQLDVPMVGSFEQGIGLFYACDVISSKPVYVRFQWFCKEKNALRWEQTFLLGGLRQETIWTMDFSPLRGIDTAQLAEQTPRIALYNCP